MTGKAPRVVLDTNVFISAILWPTSLPGQAYAKVLAQANILLSVDVQAEYQAVVGRPKFDPYLQASTRRALLKAFIANTHPVIVNARISECRDSKDNKYLELALNGAADLILTGDQDLLALHPWRGIAILNPADYLAQTQP